MWCQTCQQDVPISKGKAREEMFCARCKNPLSKLQLTLSDTRSRHSSDVQSTDRETAKPQTEMTRQRGRRENETTKSKNSSKGMVVRFDRELERIDKIVTSWSAGRSLRFDQSHAKTDATAKSSNPKQNTETVKSSVARESDSDFQLKLVGGVVLVIGFAIALFLGRNITQLWILPPALIAFGISAILLAMNNETKRLRQELQDLRKILVGGKTSPENHTGNSTLSQLDRVK